MGIRLRRRGGLRYILTVNIRIDEKVLDQLNLTEGQLKFDLALGLFVDGRVSLGRAAKIAGLDNIRFQRELGARRIPVHYGVNEFGRDLETIRTPSAR